MCENSTVRDVMFSSSDLAVMKAVINIGLSFILIIALVSTVVNLLVFYRMGYKDTVNVVITSIGCCDVVKLMCASGIIFYGPVSLDSPAMGVSWEQCTFPQVIFLHLIFANIAYVIAGYMSVERCLYVSMPLKVEAILTSKVTTAIVLTIAATIFVTLFPMMLIFHCQKTYSQSYQADFYCYNFSDFYYSLGKPYLTFYRITNITYPLVSLVCMVTSTILIAYNLYQGGKYRNLGYAENELKMTVSDQDDIKMFMVTIVMYIVCTAPRLAHFMAMLSAPGYYFLGRYHNIYWCMLYVIYFLDYFNTASHFPVFYYMGSKFRKAFNEIFCKCAEKSQLYISNSPHNFNTYEITVGVSSD